MFTRSVVYPVPDHAAMPTLLHRHLPRGFDAMRDTEGLTVDEDAGYDVLAVAVSRLLDCLPADATVADLRAAILHRALVDEPIEQEPDRRYGSIPCRTCGQTYQRIDFGSALHRLHCANPDPTEVGR
jgi:hypothetical protein